MISIDKNLFLQRTPDIIAVTSGEGSVGKTWLAITLAQAMNMQKRKVFLFDAGGGLLNIDFQMEIQNRRLLNDVINGELTFNQAIIAINRRRFDMITMAAGSDLLESMPIGRLQILRDYLLTTAQNYQHTVIDLLPTEKIIKHLMPQQMKLILVCTAEPSNLVATYQFLQRPDICARCQSLQIVINYAQSYEEGLRTYNTLRRACEQYVSFTPPLLGVIRRDTRVRDAIRNRVLLLNRYPNSEAAEDVLQIADKILKEEALGK